MLKVVKPIVLGQNELIEVKLLKNSRLTAKKQGNDIVILEEGIETPIAIYQNYDEIVSTINLTNFPHLATSTTRSVAVNATAGLWESEMQVSRPSMFGWKTIGFGILVGGGVAMISKKESGDAIKVVVPTLDTTAPVATVTADLTSDNVINITEKADGITVTGTNEAGVSISVNGQAATVNGTTWKYLLTTAEIIAMSSTNKELTIVSVDAAGNTATEKKSFYIESSLANMIETTDAPADTSTIYSLDSGQIGQGVLSASGDHDWFAVKLVGGKTYTFAMTGTGIHNATDTYLQLYGLDGVTVKTKNDNGLPNDNSIFTYTATSTGTFYIDASVTVNGNPGQYGISVTSGNRTSFDVQMGAGVVDSNRLWSTATGEGVAVTYAFRQTAPENPQNFSKLTAPQIEAVESILSMFSEVSGLTFTHVNPTGYADNATVLFSNYDANDGAGAYAYFPGSRDNASLDGDVYINTQEVSTVLLPLGSYDYFTIAHELGHAMGLSHPGLYNAQLGVSITYANDAQFIQDTHQYSVMSYFDESNTTESYFSFPDTLMLHDVYALQQNYGVNMATRSNDSVYGFNSNINGVYDFTQNTTPVLSIWDGGGIDTLDVSGYNKDQIISLAQGVFSSIGGLADNVSIALGVTIENARGGSKNDTIGGNEIGNTIYGNAGDDLLCGYAGDDLLFGGEGSDAAIFTDRFSSYSLSRSNNGEINVRTNGNDGFDRLTEIEFLRFTDQTIEANQVIG